MTKPFCDGHRVLFRLLAMVGVWGAFFGNDVLVSLAQSVTLAEVPNLTLNNTKGELSQHSSVLVDDGNHGEKIVQDDNVGQEPHAQITLTLASSGDSTVVAKSVEDRDTNHHGLENRTATTDEQALEQADELSQQAISLYSEGRYAEAIPLVEQALSIRGKFLGTTHPDTAISISNLAVLYQYQGRYEDAEPLYKQALSINEENFRSTHPDTIRSLNHLASFYFLQGRYSDAEPLYVRLLPIHEEVLGPTHPETIKRLNDLASTYTHQGRYGDAEPLYEQALEIRENVLGLIHPDTILSMNNLAVLYTYQGRYDDAEYLYEQALKIREEMLGVNHLDTIQTVNDLAGLYFSQGRYSDAERFYKRVIEIREEFLGPNHPDTVHSINGLALTYASQSQYGNAEPLLQRALSTLEETLGPNHPKTLNILNNLAGLYNSQELYSEAESLYKRVLSIREDILGLSHPNTLGSLDGLAGVYESQGRYNDAEQLLQRALSSRKEVLGLNHPDTATSMNNLAVLYISQGRYVDAEELLQSTLLILENSSAQNQLHVARSLNNLATVYSAQGRYSDAEPLYEQAFSIREEMLGPNHPDTTTSLNGLAVLYSSQGRDRDAEPLFQRLVSIREEVLGLNHSDTAISMNNLADLYKDQGRYNDAEPLYERALSINEKVLGANHPVTATIMNNLAGLYFSTNRYINAESLYERSLSIREDVLGLNHPDTATSFNDLAGLYAFQGHYSNAEPLFQRALSINEKILGSTHPDTSNSLNNLAMLYYVQGQYQSAVTHLSRGLAIQERVLSRNLVGGSDADKRDYLSTVKVVTDAAISLHLNELSTDITTAQLALNTILQRKGRILDIFTNLRGQLRDDPAALTLLNELSDTSNQLTNLTFKSPVKLSLEDYQEQIHTLQKRIRNLEDQLSRRSQVFADITTSPSLTEITAKLPARTALVEFIRYQPLDPTVGNQGSFGDPRYAAYILKADGTIQGLDLGSAQAIEKSVAALSDSLNSADTPLFQVKEAAQQLDALIMAPVRNALGTATTLFISPDGALNLIPFEALMDESERYLVETYQFRYLTSGRDLRRLDNTVNSNNLALLVGNPTYGRPGELVVQADTRAIDFEKLIFPALSGTQVEVDLLAEKLANAQVYTQTNATEAVIKEQSQPSILHVATHGFFESIESTLNPLLQSGLILAGAAAGGQSGPEQDGILSALEVTGMNLRGTQLVVLSACETGLGELTASEGIYGLRRAFVLAGSQSQVISLWKVDDRATQQLMVDYYDRLVTGAPRDAALRDTQLAFLNSEEYSHPYYWAAFIGSGDWRPLRLGK